MSLLTQASLVLTPNAYKANKLYSIIPSSGSGDMTTTRATTATRVKNEKDRLREFIKEFKSVEHLNNYRNTLIKTNCFIFKETYLPWPLYFFW